MEKEQNRTAKAHFIAQVHIGQPWQVAAERAGLHISRSTAYRLLRVYSSQGEAAFQDRRHGHPIKLRGAMRTFLETYCRQAPNTPSSAIQALLQERFGVSVSVSQINRVRVVLGISHHPASRHQEKKQQTRQIVPHSQSGRRVQGACCCLLPLTKRNCFPV